MGKLNDIVGAEPAPGLFHDCLLNVRPNLGVGGGSEFVFD
jgi:hypothetical protein